MVHHSYPIDHSGEFRTIHKDPIDNLDPHPENLEEKALETKQKQLLELPNEVLIYIFEHLFSGCFKAQEMTKTFSSIIYTNKRFTVLAKEAFIHIFQKKNFTLKSLNLSFNQIPLFLSCFDPRRITYLNLELFELPLTKDHLKEIAKLCPNLNSLNFSYCRRLQGAALAGLKQLRHLKAINLNGCMLLRDDDLIHFATIKTLESLEITSRDIEGQNITDLGLKCLIHLYFLALRRFAW